MLSIRRHDLSFFDIITYMNNAKTTSIYTVSTENYSQVITAIFCEMALFLARPASTMTHYAAPATYSIIGN